MRQALGPKKHRLCERVANKKYMSCRVRGNTEHFLAICWYSDFDADYVNYKTGEVEPYVREGRFVPSEPIEDPFDERLV